MGFVSQIIYFSWKHYTFSEVTSCYSDHFKCNSVPTEMKGNFATSKAPEKSLWKHGSVQMLKLLCWEPRFQETYPVSNEVHTQADLS